MKAIHILFKAGLTSVLVLASACTQKAPKKPALPKTITMAKARLQDKIKGAWAAQTIGCTFGSPIEFQYNATMVRDNQPIYWTDSTLAVEFRDRPGTFDDVYMDLTFMDVLSQKGLDATAADFADAIAHSSYKLWFANQTARYNLQNGLTPPASGNWMNNPCADDIDFQIESDFAGLMSPGMTTSAVALCDKVGHIMNSGDGYYGGVFVSSLYSLALVTDSVSQIESIAERAASVVPAKSKFGQVVRDVIRWHKENPHDWKYTWYKVNRKWATDTGSPLGIFRPFDIDAKINAAWVLTGLLYGNGDFTRTLEITTRCGDDADCNPSTAGGILASIIGYNRIPNAWKNGIEKVEAIPFMGTNISLDRAYDMSFQLAQQLIARNGGTVAGDSVTIQRQALPSVPLEINFPGHYPVTTVVPHQTAKEISFDFEGIGFALAGPPNITDYGSRNYVFHTEMYVDDKLVEKADLPTATNQRRFTPFWRYQLPNGKHHVVIKILNPVDYAHIELNYAVIYNDKPYHVNL